MRISCLQYTAEPDLALSESRLYPLLDEAVAARASVALLPECALFLSSDQAVSRAHALAIDSPQVEASRESYRESALFDAGTKPQLTRINGWSVGLSICFDLRFPSLYRHYALAGAELMVVPAAFTKTTGEAHWDTLLRARAIENGCFVAAAGQCGVTREGRETYGHSVVYDPWGLCLGKLDDSPGVLTIEMDRSKVETVRASVPVMSQHRDFRA
jgi:predicted amidohydrolase